MNEGGANGLMRHINMIQICHHVEVSRSEKISLSDPLSLHTLCIRTSPYFDGHTQAAPMLSQLLLGGGRWHGALRPRYRDAPIALVHKPPPVCPLPPATPTTPALEQGAERGQPHEAAGASCEVQPTPLPNHTPAADSGDHLHWSSGCFRREL